MKIFRVEKITLTNVRYTLDNGIQRIENESDGEHKRNKRRSKNETDGRSHSCKLCNKSYLSYPALYTHYKQKHNTCNTSGRGRGRPKKDTGEVSQVII